jgi:RHS repeat-associated protein
MLTRSVAVVTALTMSITLLTDVPAGAAVVTKLADDIVRERSVPGKVATGAPLPPDPGEQQAVRAAPRVSWPAAGKSTLDLAGVAALRAAAGLPVRLAGAAGTRVAVDLLGRQEDRLLLRLDRADGGTAPQRVSLEVDYSSFGDAYGGDWATRLRLVELPACAAQAPQQPECRGTPVGTRNNGSGTLSGEVTVDGDGGLFAVEAATAGPAGDFGQTPLAPSATWQAGGPSGDFSWQYAFNLPPATGGPMPKVELSYSSGSVDGRTSGTNNQTSWVGEGFDLSPGGYVERRYAPCASDMKNGANNTTKTGDLCWSSDNLTFVLNGHGGELVRDDATKTWHPRADDGSRVENIKDTGLANGDNDGEYWRITTRDGVQYYFGLNRLPGWVSGNTQTQAVWTVPVFGNHAGEPCYKAGNFAGSSCPQAWRWNLDYVVDPHLNTASYFYAQEKNRYARNVTASTTSEYVRGGYLTHIEYGQRDKQVYSTPYVGRVDFTAADRCLPGTTCTPSQPANWPDVPWNESCTSTTSCPNKFTPSFWTQKRLSKVTTRVWGGSAPRDVGSWTFGHQYRDPGDGTKPRLWLESLQRAGLPAVTFTGKQLANRVDGNDSIPVMNWWRVTAIRSESGNEIRVSYSPKECNYQTNLPAPDTNGKRCHPVRWTPEGLTERTDWFNKYVVMEVTESDRTTAIEPEVSQVEYVGAPAWRHDQEDGLVPEDRKTWSQWRGYERIRVRKGAASGPKSLTEILYFRGMDGDKTATAGVTKSVKVVDSTGTPTADTDQFAGSVRETVTYTGDGGTMLSRSITDPWLSTPTATRVKPWGTTKAYRVEQKKLTQGETIGGRWRETAVTHTYGNDGELTSEADSGDLADPSDDTCTTYSYVRNSAVWLMELPSQKRTVVGGCDRQPTGWADIVDDERLYYDGSDTLTAAPSRGLLTRRDEISGWSGGAATYLTTMQARYDANGRLTERTDPSGAKDTIAYTPAIGATTKVTATNALNQQTITELDPAWGVEKSTTAPNGTRAEAEYDSLGRVAKTWLAGRDRATQTPSATYDYLVRTDGPNVVVTSTLESNGGYRTEYHLLDGKMRLRQTQAPSPRGGRVITDQVYDSRGLKVKENGAYYNDAPPGTDLFVPDENVLPAQTITVYDGADRPTDEIFRIDGVEMWRTRHTYEVDREHITPPKGETPTTRILDAQGRLVELRQYKGETPSGAYDATKYTYTTRGQLETVTDPANNVWRYFYDARGRKWRTEDPDQGATEYTYNDRNDVVSEKDGRGMTLFYEYDALGRKVALRQGSATGPLLAGWTYDQLADGTPVPGLPASSTRYVNGRAYTTAITSYDPANHVAGQTITIPDSEGKLAGTYEFTSTYRPDGELETMTVPGGGGLPKETMTFGYDDLGLPTTLSGQTSYVTETSYTEYGEQERITMSAGGSWVRRDFQYERGTRRLALAQTRRETGAQLLASVSYKYDPAGNITRISDQPDPATGVAADTQCFRHDYLRRLVQAWTPASGDCGPDPSAAALGGAAPYWHSWALDAVGNRLSETRTAPDGTKTTSVYTYGAAGTGQPHALRGVTTTGPGGTKTDGYSYDPAGNLATRTRAGVGQTLEWDAEGHLVKVTENGKTTSYLYDAAGERLIRRDPSGITLYLGNTELHMDTNNAVVGTRYYNHADHTIAKRDGLNGRLTWLVSDHHGTAELAIDEVGQQVGRQRHDPYGNTRGTGTPKLAGDRGFVGGTTDDSTGLTHLGAREYDPTTGRFISVDPEVDPEDPQTLHGYAYANNSPVSFTDPDGRAWIIKRVVSYKTVYRTVIKKVVRTVRYLVTMYVQLFFLLVFMMTMPVSVPITFWVVKRVIEYIKVIEKQLVRVVRLIRIYKKEPSRKNLLRLAAFGRHLDRNNEVFRQINEAVNQAMNMVQQVVTALLKAAWNYSLKTVRGGIGMFARFNNPLAFVTNRAQSWLIGKGVEGLTWITGGQCTTQSGLRTCHGGWVPYGRMGTTYGDTFVGKDRQYSKSFLDHEKVHRDKQWRRYGVLFGVMYGVESLRTWGNPCTNEYEQEAGAGRAYSRC